MSRSDGIAPAYLPFIPYTNHDIRVDRTAFGICIPFIPFTDRTPSSDRTAPGCITHLFSYTNRAFRSDGTAPARSSIYHSSPKLAGHPEKIGQHPRIWSGCIWCNVSGAFCLVSLDISPIQPQYRQDIPIRRYSTFISSLPYTDRRSRSDGIAPVFPTPPLYRQHIQIR